VEGSTETLDERFAEWYAWAKREVSTEGRVCLGAAQAAVEALEAGGDEQAARAAARRSVAGQGIGLITRVSPRRRAYAEWYDWARKELGGGPARQHTAAKAALDVLDRDGDAEAAVAAARAAVAEIPGADAPSAPPPSSDPAAPVPSAPVVPAQGPVPAAVAGQPAWMAPVASAAAPGLVLPAAAAGGYAPSPHQALAVPAPPSPAPAHAYGGLWRRLGAAVVDYVLVAIGTVILAVVVSFFAIVGVLSTGQPLNAASLGGVSLALIVIAIVLQWLYFAGLESSSWQATIGKRFFQLVVADGHGRRISFGRATGRYAPKVFPVAVTLFAVTVPLVVVVLAALVIDLICLVPLAGLIPLTRRRQGLQDLMAGTVVVRREHLPLLTSPLPQVQPQGSPGGAGEVQGA